MQAVQVQTALVMQPPPSPKNRVNFTYNRECRATLSNISSILNPTAYFFTQKFQQKQAQNPPSGLRQYYLQAQQQGGKKSPKINIQKYTNCAVNLQNSNQNGYRSLNQTTLISDIILGKGSTGNVLEGKEIDKDNKVAIKVIDLGTIDNEVLQYLLKCEKQALRILQAESFKNNIVGLHSIIETGNKCHIVMDYLQGPSLKQIIKLQKANTSSFTTELSSSLKILETFSKIAKSYSIVASHGILHRDLKPQNIIFHGSQPYLIDFGYCVVPSIQKPQFFYNVGSPKYMSPEAYCNCQYSQKSDVWALGVTLFEMFTGKTLDYGIQMDQCYRKIRAEGIRTLIHQNAQCEIPKQAINLLEGMLNFNKDRRLSIERVIAELDKICTEKDLKQSFMPSENSQIDTIVSKDITQHFRPYKLSQQPHKQIRSTIHTFQTQKLREFIHQDRRSKNKLFAEKQQVTGGSETVRAGVSPPAIMDRKVVNRSHEHANLQRFSRYKNVSVDRIPKYKMNLQDNTNQAAGFRTENAKRIINKVKFNYNPVGPSNQSPKNQVFPDQKRVVPFSNNAPKIHIQYTDLQRPAIKQAVHFEYSQLRNNFGINNKEQSKLIRESMLQRNIDRIPSFIEKQSQFVNAQKMGQNHKRELGGSIFIGTIHNH